jgi:hypothetical protein
MGTVQLNDPERPGDGFSCRVVEIERRTKGTKTYLGASQLLKERDWSAEQIADLYFDRWPCQEANFRAANQALGIKRVHGYGKQLVDNVAVVTKLDELKRKIDAREVQKEHFKAKLDEKRRQLHDEQEQLRSWRRRGESLNRQLEREFRKCNITIRQSVRKSGISGCRYGLVQTIE